MGSKNQAFVVPAGLVFEQVDEGLSIEHDGDVVLHSSLGLRIHRIRSNNGNIAIHIDLELDEIAAPKGVVSVHGSLQSDSVLGRSIEVAGALSALGVYGGAIRVSGDIEADNLTAEDGGILIGGSARVKDELSAEGGDIIVEGNIRAGSITASRGRVVLKGDAETSSITAHTDVEIHGAATAVNLVAGKAVAIHSDLQAQSIRAERVSADGDRLDVKLIQATNEIDVGSSQIHSDLFIAPTVQIRPESEGHVTVVESHNDVGPSKVKGCLRLEHLAALIGNVDRFLADRGVEPLADSGSIAMRAVTASSPVKASRSTASPRPSARSAAPKAAPAPAAAEPAPAPSAPAAASPARAASTTTASPAGHTTARGSGRSSSRRATSSSKGRSSTRGRSTSRRGSAKSGTTRGVRNRGSRSRTTDTSSDGSKSGDDVPAEPRAGDAEASAAASPAAIPAAAAAAASASEAHQRVSPEPTEVLSVVPTADALNVSSADTIVMTSPPGSLDGELVLPEPSPSEATPAELDAVDDQTVEMDGAQAAAMADQADAEPSADVADDDDAASTADDPPANEGPTLMLGEDLFDLEDEVDDGEAIAGLDDDEAVDDPVSVTVSTPAADAAGHVELDTQGTPIVGPPMLVDEDDDDVDLDEPVVADGPDPAILAAMESTVDADDDDDGTVETVFDMPTAPLEDLGPVSSILGVDTDSLASTEVELGVVARPGPVDAPDPVTEISEAPPAAGRKDEGTTADVEATQPEVLESVDAEPTPAPAAPPRRASPRRSSRAGAAPLSADNDPITMLMLETVGRMVRCYAKADTPPSVSRLRELVESRDYDRIRQEFNSLWDDLQKYHRDNNLGAPHPRVSHTFRTIDTIVRNL